ncbi:hypothetical protein VSP9026_03422 [Vibrio spartinae]|uniref:Uncharacterized protein n=1 Tax=Vibrio spartinae TaxID=1918945 RepID=A0A1N6M899_9VIBR|nr:hypothetical protein VSP9026_03422 [Vibrio spartinae]
MHLKVFYLDQKTEADASVFINIDSRCRANDLSISIQYPAIASLKFKT